MSQNSRQPEGLQPELAAHRSVEQGPRSRGCDREGGRESRGFGALPVAFRGSHPSIQRLEPAPPSTRRRVARLGNRITIAFTVRLAITNSGCNAHVFYGVRDPDQTTFNAKASPA